MSAEIDYHFEDFTEIEYRKLLQLLKGGWEVIAFSDYRKPGRVCLWRHDVDFSVHRALKLAQIEAEEGITSTFFIHLHSKFYNPLEDEVVERVNKIINLGHDLGLHFDPEFYALQVKDHIEGLKKLIFERDVLENLFKTTVRSFSFHNPDIGGWLQYDHDEINGMVNAYGKYLRQNYSYCSDSNGYWRFRRLRDVLENATDEKLHVLTHPEMWTPEAMSPHARVVRSIEGRAANQIRWYDDILASQGRENVQ